MVNYHVCSRSSSQLRSKLLNLNLDFGVDKFFLRSLKKSASHCLDEMDSDFGTIPDSLARISSRTRGDKHEFLSDINDYPLCHLIRMFLALIKLI